MRSFKEYLAEVSSETLHWYVSNAVDDAVDEPTPEGKRRKGMRQAVDRLTGQTFYRAKHTKAGRKHVQKLKKKS